jgi:hypothetical protein
MKKKLTKEQKINEFIGKALSAFLNKRASKSLAKAMKNDPQLKKHLDDMDVSARRLKDLMKQK